MCRKVMGSAVLVCEKRNSKPTLLRERAIIIIFQSVLSGGIFFIPKRMEINRVRSLLVNDEIVDCHKSLKMFFPSPLAIIFSTKI